MLLHGSTSEKDDRSLIGEIGNVFGLMKSIKLCMLAPDFYPYWGGVGVNVVEIVRNLPKNFEIHVVAVSRGAYDGKELSKMLGFGDNVKIHFVTSANDNFLYNANFQLKCLGCVKYLAERNDIDVIQSHMAHIPDAFLRFRTHKPIVTNIHSTIRLQFKGITKYISLKELESSEKWTLLLYPLLEAIHSAYFLRRSNSYYITGSEFMRNFVEKAYGISITRVIPNSIDVEYVNSCLKEKPSIALTEDQLIILYAGRLVKYKGVRTLIEAVPRILSEVGRYGISRDKLCFVFAGPGNKYAYVRKLKELKVPSENFRFTGSLPRNELLRLMSRSRCVVVPSYIDNIPNSVLEAMSCRVPVVASRVGGIPEEVIDGESGILVEPGNSSELAKAIMRLIEDEDLARRMGARGAKLVEQKFSWNVNIQKYVDLYEEIAQ